MRSSAGSADAPSLYLQTPLVLFEDDATEEFRCPMNGKVAPLGDHLLREVAAKIDWDLLHALVHGGGRAPVSLCQMWAGDGRGATPMHYDRNDNFLSQVVGRKRVLLMPPDEVFNVYLHPVDHPLDRHAMCDLGDPDFDRFPALRRAKGVSCDLDPRVAASGDAPPPARSIDQSIAPCVAGGTRSSFRRIGSTTCGNSGVPARTTYR